MPEKIAIGAFNWLFHLVSDIDGSNQNAGKGTGIPGPVLSVLKELFHAAAKERQDQLQGKEISFSKWISKLFNGTHFKDDEETPSASTSERKWAWLRNCWSNPYPFSRTKSSFAFLHRLEACIRDPVEQRHLAARA